MLKSCVNESLQIAENKCRTTKGCEQKILGGRIRNNTKQNNRYNRWWK